VSAADNCHCSGTGWDGCSEVDAGSVSGGGGIVASLVSIGVACVLIVVSLSVILQEAAKTVPVSEVIEVLVAMLAFVAALVGGVWAWCVHRRQAGDSWADTEVRRRALAVLIATVAVRGMVVPTNELASLVAGVAIPAGGTIEDQARRLVVIALNREADRVGISARCTAADLVVA
jgi:hypothetical protein